MPIKLKDIAEQTGYSITTVSRALGGYHDVNEMTRERILSHAKMMGYQPNQVALQLRNQQTKTIGMIIPATDEGFSDAFFSELMMGAGHAASHNGYDFLLSAQISEEDEMKAYHRIVGGNRVDGVIVARTRQDDPRIAYLKKQNFPFVVSGRNSPNHLSDFPYIDVDSHQGIYNLVTYLVELGHQNIALLLPPQDLAYTPYRLSGYSDAIRDAEYPINPNYVLYGDLKREGGFVKAKYLLLKYPEITAIVACNDLMALGAIQAAQELGRNVGKDISITGFDDIPAAQFSHPPLTTVNQPIYEIGQQLVEMLLRIIHTGQTEGESIILKPKLVLRESSGEKLM